MTDKSMIPGRTDEEQAWQALRRQVAEHGAEQSFVDDKRRLGDLEDKFAILLGKVESIVSQQNRDYKGLTEAYDRLVTKLEFHPFKVMVWGQCIFMMAVVLILIVGRK